MIGIYHRSLFYIHLSAAIGGIVGAKSLSRWVLCISLTLLVYYSGSAEAQGQHTFALSFEFGERIDRSSEAWPWIYIGSGTREVPRTERTIGCAGTYPNGAPARVRCNQPTYILSPQYECVPVRRPTYVGSEQSGTIPITTLTTSKSDGHNADGCMEQSVGTTEARTRHYMLYIAGARWQCPTGYNVTDVDGDGSVYGDEEFPYRYNPEACIRHYCPSGSEQVYAPNDPDANSSGFVCEGTNPEKQPRSCPMVGDPVIVATGNSFQTEVDFESVTPGGLRFVRYHNTRGAERVGGRLSPGWSHNYESKVAGSHPRFNIEDPRPSPHVTVIEEDGQSYIFRLGTELYTEDGYTHVKWVADIDNTSTALVQVLDPSMTLNAWLYTTEQDHAKRYDANGRLQRITYRQGHAVELFYNVATTDGGDGVDSTLDKVVGDSGAELRFEYDSMNRISTFVDPEGYSYSYTYDAAGNLASTTYPDETTTDATGNPIRTYHYENAEYPSFLTGITDENGDRFASWSYDSDGRAISSELAGGLERYTLTHNTDGSVTVTNPLGKVSTYHFDTVEGVKLLSQVDGEPTASCAATTLTTTYDQFGNALSSTDAKGNITQYSTNSRGLQTSRTEAFGSSEERTTTTTWHPDLRLPLTVNKPGQMISFHYNLKGQPLTRTVTDESSGRSRVWSYTYHPEGSFGAFRVATVDGPRTDLSDVTSFEYTEEGLVHKIINPLGHTTEFTAYNSRGLPLEMIDPNGVVTQMTYSPRGWLLTSTVLDPSGGAADATTAYEYDDAGQLSRVTLPDGSYLSYEYDEAHRLVAIGNNVGESQQLSLDDVGNITRINTLDSGGLIARNQQFVYDELSRVLQNIGGASQVVENGYDVNDNLAESSRDPQGFNQTTSRSFDALDRLQTVTDALSNSSTYGYDERDNLVSVTDPRGLQTSYVYDGLDNLLQINSPDTGTTTYTYDDAGNRISQNDARGIVSNYSYDALGRITQVTFPASPGENISYSYDGVAVDYGIGRLTGLIDQSGGTTYTYDHRGNLLESTVLIGSNSYTTSYAYDLADNLVETTYPSGRIVQSQRDAIGRTTAVTTREGSSAVEDVLADGITYYPFGPLSSLTYGNGLVRHVSVDGDYRVDAISVADPSQPGNPVFERMYTVNEVNNITAISDGIDATRSQLFSYDGENRLVHAQGAYGQKDYTYDAVGNRTSLNSLLEGVSTLGTYIYDSTSNQLLKIDQGSQSRIFNYDASGNVISDDRGAEPGIVMEYNDQNRLIRVTPDQGAQQ